MRASRARRSGTIPWTPKGSVMIWPTVIRGLSELYGSWKMTWTRRRTARSSTCPSFVGSRPSSLAAGRPLELEDAAACSRLAAAGLTHEPEDLGPANGEADAVHRLDHAGRSAEQPAADLEMLDEIAHLEDQVAGHVGTALPSSLATQHALRCSALTRSSGGTSARHRSMT